MLFKYLSVTMRRLFVLLIVLQCFYCITRAQTWEADWRHDGELSNLWQGDRSHYVVKNGELALRAPKGSKTSYIYRSVKLGDEHTWQGVIRMTSLPTASNYTYILLAELQAQDTQIRCLALAFGGEHEGIRLCEATFSKGSRDHQLIHQKKEDINLINFKSYPRQLLTGLAYQVNLTKEGYLLLYLSQDNPQVADLVEQIPCQMQLHDKQQFGFYIAHTEKGRESVSLSNINYSDRVESSSVESHDSESEESVREGTDFLLSEVMANPLEGSAEYIELYHVGDVNASLTEYSLGIGSTREQVKRYPMNRFRQLLTPGGYYVLTTEPDAIRRSYPNSYADCIMEAKLPQLRNAGFVLQLYRGRELVDEVEYSPKALGKGLKSRRGVAYERTNMQVGSVVWRAARSDYGYATPTQQNSQLGQGGTTGESPVDEDDTAKLSQLISQLEQSSQSSRVLFYDFSGKRIADIPSAEVLALLRAIQTNPYQVLQRFSLTDRAMIMVVNYVGADGERESYSFKYQLISP